MSLLTAAPALAPAPAFDFADSPVGEAALFDAAGFPVVTVPDIWGIAELDHQQDFEDMVDVSGWPDLDNLPDGPFDYPA